jgi:hypothetical protein
MGDWNRLILLVLIGEILEFYIFHILAHGFGNGGM